VMQINLLTGQNLSVRLTFEEYFEAASAEIWAAGRPPLDRDQLRAVLGDSIVVNPQFLGSAFMEHLLRRRGRPMKLQPVPLPADVREALVHAWTEIFVKELRAAQGPTFDFDRFISGVGPYD
jgi:hypothetical protein